MLHKNLDPKFTEVTLWLWLALDQDLNQISSFMCRKLQKIHRSNILGAILKVLTNTVRCFGFFLIIIFVCLFFGLLYVVWGEKTMI